MLVFNPQVTTVFPKGLAIKLEAVVRDEGVKDPKPSNDVLPDKPLSIYIPDVGQRLGFDLFGEIVCVDQ